MTRQITDRPLKIAGRKPKQPPKDAAARIEAWAGDGFSVIGIAKRLGTCADTYRRWMEEYPDLKEAMQNGRENERHQLHNVLFKQATEAGNTTAAIFLLKARHNYRDQGLDINEAGNKVTINFALPDAMTMAEFQTPKVIENGTPDNRNAPVSAQRVVVARGS